MNNKILFIVALAAIAAACHGNSAHISGRISGDNGGQCVYLEELTADSIIVCDSTITKSHGRFDFRIDIPDGQPALYNLRLASQNITLLPASGERIRVSVIGALRGYKVSGSVESELIHQIGEIMSSGATRLDSIASVLPLTETDTALRHAASRAYVREYIAIKREQIQFIVENCHYLAAIYALAQRLPNDPTLFNGESDIIYYRLVADSVAVKYPKSPYLLALKKVVDDIDSQTTLSSMLSASFENPITHPNITLNDMYGKQQSLDNNLGRATLLVFWSYTTKDAAMDNAELRKLWNDYSARGLAIYQVSLDHDRTLWINAVQEQRLPWISVLDIRGANSTAAMTYNVKSLPTIFLLDGEGNIVGKNLAPAAFSVKIDKLLK